MDTCISNRDPGGARAGAGPSGMESHIPWDAIHDDLPQWRTDDDPEFVKTREALEKLARMLKAGALTSEDYERRREAMFES